MMLQVQNVWIILQNCTGCLKLLCVRGLGRGLFFVIFSSLPVLFWEVAFYIEDILTNVSLGQLALVEMHLKTNSHISDDIQKMHKRIADSYRQARDISALALGSLNESDQHFYRIMRPVIQRPWSFGKNYRRLDPNLKWKNDISLGKGTSKFCSCYLVF